MFSADKAGKASAPSDPYFYDVSLLLTGDGTNGAQNNTFLDSSTNNFTITRNGNTTQGSFSPYGSLWSNYFGGSGDYLSVADNAAFGFGTGDFTCEGWFNSSVTSGAGGIFNVTPGSLAGTALLLRQDLGGYQLFLNGSYAIATATIPVNQWTHFAIVRASGIFKFYINGIQLYSISDTTNYASGSVSIGYAYDTTYAYTGYLSNIRIVKGTALYTSSFTPSTTPLTAVSGTSLLTCQSNRFIDNSSNNFALTVSGTPSVQRFSPFNPTASYTTATIGGSGYFDGSGDYLSIAGPATGTGSWTIEGWFYFLSFTSARGLFSQGTVDTPACFVVWTNSDGSIWFSSGGELAISPAGVLKVGMWQHIAIVSNSNNLAIYVNGVSVATGSYSGKTFNGSPFQINQGYVSVTEGRNCYASDVRMVVGTAVYTSAFTPPTAPLTAISGTSLLCNMTNAGIYDSAMMNDLETVGNAQISTSVKKYGTGSMYFDGTGDYIVSPTFGSTNSPSAIYSPNGAFTVECWINPTDRSSRSVVGYGTSSTIWVLQFDGSNHIQFKWVNTSPTVYIAVSTSTIPTGSWTHVAATYDGTSIKVFVNGTLEATTATSGTLRSVSSPILGVGSWGGSFSDPTYYGYIDDLRITNGYARYTSNFTPPAQAFPTY